MVGPSGWSWSSGTAMVAQSNPDPQGSHSASGCSVPVEGAVVAGSRSAVPGEVEVPSRAVDVGAVAWLPLWLHEARRAAVTRRAVTRRRREVTTEVSVGRRDAANLRAGRGPTRRRR